MTFVVTDKDQNGVPKLMTLACPKTAPGLAVWISRPIPVAFFVLFCLCEYQPTPHTKMLRLTKGADIRKQRDKNQIMSSQDDECAVQLENEGINQGQTQHE